MVWKVVVIMNFKIPNGINKVPFSIRVDDNDFQIIQKLSKKNKKSYNYIINCMIKFAIENMNMEDIKNITLPIFRNKDKEITFVLKEIEK